MNSALELIHGSHAMLEVDGAGHDLLPKKTANELPCRVVSEFKTFLKNPCQRRLSLINAVTEDVVTSTRMAAKPAYRDLQDQR
jgi:hypothetical protein